MFLIKALTVSLLCCSFRDENQVQELIIRVTELPKGSVLSLNRCSMPKLGP